MTIPPRFLGVLVLLLSLGVNAMADFDRGEIKRARPEIAQHFSNIPLLSFEYTPIGEAIIRLLDTRKNSFIFEQGRYFGFRFRTPPDPSGDFACLFLLSNPTGPATLTDFGWCIAGKDGGTIDLPKYKQDELHYLPKLRERFPNTQIVLTQRLDGDKLTPDEEYLFLFRIPRDASVPPLAVAFSMKTRERFPPPHLPLSFSPTAGSRPSNSHIEGDPW